VGLDERRAMKKFETDLLPGFQKQINDAAGFDVPLEIHWDKLTIDGRAKDACEPYYLADIFFTPLVAALKEVGSDQMGKDALKAGLKKIVMTYDEETAPISNYVDGWPFEDGVLTINYQPGVIDAGYADPIEARTKSLVQILSSGL
jgi:hypothetical protein